MVAHIRSVDAVELLTELQAKVIEAPTIVGERRMIYSGYQPDQQLRYTLANTISLDAAQANELLRFLQANEPLLQKLAAEDAEQWQQALRSAYKVFIESYLRRNR